MNKRGDILQIIQWVRRNKIILLLLGALFLQRLYAAYTVGITYNIDSDDLGYIDSGITFMETGMITMHGVLSAQIMPGMPVLIGLFASILGEGRLLWIGLKCLWFLMGVGSAYYVYKTVCILAPKWCAYLAILPYFCADFVWMDNLILTETPFMFCFAVMLYATIMMGKERKWKYFWICLFSYMIALMFKANIALYPIFAFIYLLMTKYDFKLLLRQGLILGGIILCFVIPWSIRNYIHYDSFVPLTWGAGNPMLLGTYQGRGYPADEDLDYEKNVDKVAEAKFQKYYDDKGKVKKDYLEKYLALEKDMIKAKYRMSEWFKSNPLNMLESYLYLKPKMMINSVFYWESIMDVPVDGLVIFRKFNFLLCLISLFTSIYVKKHKEEMLFLTAVYIGNIYIYAMTFAFDRYAETLMPIRCIMMGVGFYLFGDLIRKLSDKNRMFEKQCKKVLL